MEKLSREIRNKIVNEILSELKSFDSFESIDDGWHIELVEEKDNVHIDFRCFYGYLEQVKDFVKQVEVIYFLKRTYDYNGNRIK